VSVRKAPGEGSVSRRNNGLWQASLQVGGIRRTVYGKTEREAKRKLTQLQKDLVRAGRLPDPGRRTVDDLLDAWLEAVKPSLKPRTVQDYKETLDRYIRPTLGKMKLAKLEPYHIQRLYSDLQKRGDRVVTLAHARLNQALRMGVMWNWLPYNPVDRVIKPTYKPERKDVWTAEELATFLRGTQEDSFQPLWITLLGTGCRLGEALALKWTDVDLTSGSLRIRRSLQYVSGKWVETLPKTKAGERTIGLPQEVVDALKRQKFQQYQWRLKAGEVWSDNGLVFTTRSGGPLHRFNVEHTLKARCRDLSIPELTPHGLRHLSASLLLNKGLPLTDVSARLGHAHTGITASVYAHALKRDDPVAVEVLNAVLNLN